MALQHFKPTRAQRQRRHGYHNYRLMARKAKERTNLCREAR